MEAERGADMLLRSPDAQTSTPAWLDAADFCMLLYDPVISMPAKMLLVSITVRVCRMLR